MASHQLVIFVLIVTICLVVPSSLLVICIAFRFRVAGIHRQHSESGGESAAEAGASHAIGLDETTIQSYQKIVVDEWGQLVSVCKGESSCSICLAEYMAGEIARCMPGCQHCFHIDCVDKWLKMNTTCPVCRKCLLFSKLHDKVVPNL
ncbi:RING-H2 finger protein ATL20-like [Capsicum galapagoense]